MVPLRDGTWVFTYGLVCLPIECIFLFLFVLRSKKAPLIARNTFLTVFMELGGMSLIVMWMFREPDRFKFSCPAYHFTVSISLPIYFGGILCFLWRFYFLFNFQRASHEEVKNNKYSALSKTNKSEDKELNLDKKLEKQMKTKAKEPTDSDVPLSEINNTDDDNLKEPIGSEKEKKHNSSTSSSSSSSSSSSISSNESNESNDNNASINLKSSKIEQSEGKEKINGEEDDKKVKSTNDDNISYYIKHRSRTTNRSIIIICLFLFLFHLTLALITYYTSENYQNKTVGCLLSTQSMGVFSVITFTYFFLIFYFGIKIRKYKDNFYIKLESYSITILIFVGLSIFYLVELTSLNEKMTISTTVFLLPFMFLKFFFSVIFPVIVSYVREYQFNILDEEKLIEFKTVLENPIPLEYFKKFCIHDFCVENIMFWLAVRKYNNTVDENERKDMFDEFNEIFIKNGARYQINISYIVRNQIANLPEENIGDIDIFNKAQKEIYNLMLRNTFVEFIGSSIWQEMIEKLKENEQIQLINRYSTLV
ncbi:double hit isoform b [Anaeramoeba flamelloides]|uniref:Double hit isoform b n=1 Tax=Anaeramoeba flamelloides TaxID=1746091 RepID=A0AAV7YED5_9EUKA|nr:double hit isoform b [Anaeramoeba flamelloides]